MVQSSKFELVINAQTARMLSLDMPPMLLALVAFDHEHSLRSREFIISWLTPTPHATAVYASCSVSPPPHATLASRRLARF